RTLNIIVEREQMLAIAFQDRPRMGCREVFPLEAGMGHFLADGLNKLVDEVIVLLSFKAFVPPSDVQRIIQKLLIVGAHIQHDRQCPGWVYAADERVKRELADGDA